MSLTKNSTDTKIKPAFYWCIHLSKNKAPELKTNILGEIIVKIYVNDGSTTIATWEIMLPNGNFI